MEAAGLAVGVVALSGLIETCVSCFQYVQVGKRFGKDHQRARLKLDVLELRLCRWATAVKCSVTSPSPHELRKAETLLKGIINTFNDAERVSAKYSSGFSRYTHVAVASDDGDLEKLHVRMSQMALESHKQISLKNKVSWAIYGRGDLDRLLQDLTELMNGLVEVFPAARQEQEQRAGTDTEKLTKLGGGAIKKLVDATAGLDPMLQTSIRRSLENPYMHSYDGNVAMDAARARYGDEVNRDSIPTGVVGNSYSKNTTSGRAMAHFGNSFGGRSIFD